jgi:fumarylacetoacetase
MTSRAGVDPTLDPALESWVGVPTDSDFPIQNLPYGVFSTEGRSPRVGVAIGDHILDLAALADDGHLDGFGLPLHAVGADRLNLLISESRATRRALRERLSLLLSRGNSTLQPDAGRYLVSAAEAAMHLPCAIGDYVDFYSSIEHATNLGRLFRPDGEPLLPNWRHLPVAYHGRASTIVVSGTPVVRPRGQRKAPSDQAPSFGPSTRLDFELEVGFFTGGGPQLGTPIAVGDADDHIFGFTLVNDWSARDLQAWEYVPLGPFLGKSFATTVAPWVVTSDALAPFRVDPPPQDPLPLPYLSESATLGLDLALEVELNDSLISATTFRGMYWTPAQQLAHATSNGTQIREGDLYASGTVSGVEPGSAGSLIELTWNGADPIELADGSSRTFLEDGDTVTLRGRCETPGAAAIGFGICAGTVTG